MTTTEAELRAAAERVVTWYESMKSHGGGWDELASQIVAVSRAWLAEHPADDGEAVTDGRLEAIVTGLENDDFDWNWKPQSDKAVYVVEVYMHGKWWDVPLPAGVKVGAVRRILSALS